MEKFFNYSILCIISPSHNIVLFSRETQNTNIPFVEENDEYFLLVIPCGPAETITPHGVTPQKTVFLITLTVKISQLFECTSSGRPEDEHLGLKHVEGLVN